MIKLSAFMCLWLTGTTIALGYIEEPGPRVKQTHGAVWPKPFSQVSDYNFVVVNTTDFVFQLHGPSCDLLERSLKRYRNIIKRQHVRQMKIRRRFPTADESYSNIGEEPNYFGQLAQLHIYLETPCDVQNSLISMNESYYLDIHAPSQSAILSAGEVWGVLRGLETFSHLLYLPPSDGLSDLVRLNSTVIVDSPRYKYRGLMLDTSRHFIAKSLIFKILDAMAYNKLNVFHWHIVDDQSFPFESVTFPDLSKYGAFHPSMIYTPVDVQSIIKYARDRGIRVIPEFDSPGHTRAWGVKNTSILTECYESGRPSGKYGPLDPTLAATYNFVYKLYNEISQVFDDPYVHLGGDEVDFDCWESNPSIQQFMHVHNLTDFRQLEEIYIQKVVDGVDSLGKKTIVWEEVFENGVHLPNSTIVQVWINSRTLRHVTAQNRPALLSACWYLDHLSTGGDWQKFYQCEPNDYVYSEVERQLVHGGEACMWSEVVDANNVLSRIWPRASATAEKLWSPEILTKDLTEAARRLEEHTCRLNFRDIPAQPPNGPGFCA